MVSRAAKVGRGAEVGSGLELRLGLMRLECDCRFAAGIQGYEGGRNRVAWIWLRWPAAANDVGDCG